MHIGILQTGLVVPELAQEHGQYPEMMARMLAPFGFSFTNWAVVESYFPDGPEAADGWLITGSRHAIYEDHPWLPPLRALIRKIYAADRPMVGICFGHQVIAQALGGDVGKFSGGWSVGPQEYDFQDGRKTVQAWHQDQVITPPDGALTVASSPFCAHAALVYPGKAYTVQPHPEFDDAFTRGLIEKRGRGVVPDALLSDAGARIGTPLGSGDIAAQIARFFRQRSIS